MSGLTPIYTAENVKIAYQLNWSLSVFWHDAPFSDDWLPALRQVTEADGVRILEHRFVTPTCSLFLISTRPELLPQEIPRSVKGRLQYLVRDRWPKAFQRNYDLRSNVSTSREKVEAYVASQLEHHLPDDDRIRAVLSDLQVIRQDVDLSRPRFVAYARYWCNLHLVLVHDWRHRETNPSQWLQVRTMILKACEQKGWLLSRLGFVPDHLHLAFGSPPNVTPQSTALSLMNNIAFAHNMQPVLMKSCYMTTFGEYDLGAIETTS